MEFNFEDDDDYIDALNHFYGVIYKITNNINGKIYIGKTKQFFKKYINGKFKHLTKENYNIGCKYINSAILKYGIENFSVKLIDLAYTLKKLNELEQKYIIDFNSRNPKIGYNIAKGGDGGCGFIGHKHSEESKNKMRKSAIGRKLSEETKQKMSASRLGRKVSQETKQKLSNTNKGTIVLKDKDGNYIRVKITDSRYKNGELISMTTNKVTVIDANGNTFQVSKTDPRYLSDELKHISIGMIHVKDKNNNFYYIKKDDPRFLNGELVGIMKIQINVDEFINNIKMLKDIDALTSKYGCSIDVLRKSVKRKYPEFYKQLVHNSNSIAHKKEK